MNVEFKDLSKELKYQSVDNLENLHYPSVIETVN